MSVREDESRNLAWLGIAAASIALLYVLGPVVTPFFLAAILAYVGQPLVLRMSRRMPRTAAVILALLLGSFAVLTFLIAMAKITGAQQ